MAEERYTLAYPGAQADALLQKVETAGDRVRATGTLDFWTWQTWESGKAECWGWKLYTDTLDQQAGSLFYGAEHQEDLPNGLFSSLKSLQLSVDGNALLWYGKGSSNTKTQKFYFAYPVQMTTSGSYYVYFYAVGKWN